ncbi:MAG: ABC transporter substrate-binding protein [Chloroflexi bacterium]|nr:ABC transporter substrate-binding protein [Chloroflexota bacterium]
MKSVLSKSFVLLIVLAVLVAVLPSAAAQDSSAFRKTFELTVPATDGAFAGVDPSGQTVTWWHNHSNAREERVNELVAEFNANNPWGITVEASNQGSYDDIYGKIIAGLTSGELPNLVVAYQNQALAYKAGGGIVDLNPYVTDPTVGLNEAEVADFIPAFFTQDIAPDGVRIGFPPNRSAEVLYYNRSALAELGYDAPPANWDEFREMACAFTAGGWSGYTGDAPMGYSVRTDASNVAALTYALGADIFDAETNTYTYNNEATITALTFMQSLVADGCANLIAENFADQNDFAAGKNLFYMGSTSGIPFIASAIQESGVALDWGVTFIPYGETPAVDIYGASVSIIAGSSTPEQQLATWLFVRWFTEADQQASWAAASNYFPVRISTAQNLGDVFAESPQFEEAFNLLVDGQGFVEPATAGYDVVRDNVAAAFQSILVEGVDVQATLEALDTAANEIEASFQ